MNKRLWFFAGTLIVISLALIVKFGLSPKAVRLIKPRSVKSTEEAGAMVWQRLRYILKNEKNIVFGLQNSSPKQLGLIKGFMRAAVKEKYSFAKKGIDVRFQIGSLLEDDWEESHIEKDLDQWVEIFKGKDDNSNVKNVFVMSNLHSSHLITETPLKKIEDALKTKLVSLTILRIALSYEGISQLKPFCDSNGTLGSGDKSALGCIAKRKSLFLIKKNMKKDQPAVSLDQYGDKDYIVFLYEPVS